MTDRDAPRCDACEACDGSGEINTCCDDLCQGDECIHGDGIVMCDGCNGTGEAT